MAIRKDVVVTPGRVVDERDEQPFGPPPLIEGEDRAALRNLFGLRHRPGPEVLSDVLDRLQQHPRVLDRIGHWTRLGGSPRKPEHLLSTEPDGRASHPALYNIQVRLGGASSVSLTLNIQVLTS
jgi:hypothetical protein